MALVVANVCLICFPVKSSVHRTLRAGLYISMRGDAAEIHANNLIKEKQQQVQHINNTKI